MLDTLVFDLTPKKEIFAVNTLGIHQVNAKSIILAMGCRERPRGALFSGSRPAGVFTAGTIQRLVNMNGLLPGKRAVILGSGDIGLIMARRLTLEGMCVEGVYEINPYPGGLMRNVVQCLHDYGIPLHLQHTIVEVHGEQRLTGVSIAQVDIEKKVIEGTRRFVACDTLLLSVGLIPENELSIAAGIELHPLTRGPIVNQHCETLLPGIFACGNVLHVHDVVDHVSLEAERAAEAAVLHVSNLSRSMKDTIPISPGQGIHAIAPQLLQLPADDDYLTIRGRVKSPSTKPRIVASSRGNALWEQAYPVLRPAEMFAFRLPKEALVDVSGNITIALKEGS